jgi:hypothetical protein
LQSLMLEVACVDVHQWLGVLHDSVKAFPVALCAGSNATARALAHAIGRADQGAGGGAGGDAEAELEAWNCIRSRHSRGLHGGGAGRVAGRLAVSTPGWIVGWVECSHRSDADGDDPAWVFGRIPAAMPEVCVNVLVKMLGGLDTGSRLEVAAAPPLAAAIAASAAGTPRGSSVLQDGDGAGDLVIMADSYGDATLWEEESHVGRTPLQVHGGAEGEWCVRLWCSAALAWGKPAQHSVATLRRAIRHARARVAAAAVKVMAEAAAAKRRAAAP